jgi:hypothetical protein
VKLTGNAYINGVFSDIKYENSNNLDKKMSNITLQAKSSLFNISSDYSFAKGETDKIEDSTGSGNVSIQTGNLKSLLGVLFGKNNNVYQQVSFSQELKLTFQPSSSKGLLKVKNIVVTSEAIDGKGEISYNSKNIANEKSLINFDLQRLNFDKLLTQGIYTVKPFWLDQQNSVNITTTALKQDNLSYVVKKGIFAFSPFRTSDFTTTIRII